MTDVEFSPDGKHLAVGDGMGMVRLFDVKTGGLVDTLVNPQENQPGGSFEAEVDPWWSVPRACGAVKSLAFSPDGNLLAVAGESFGEVSYFRNGLNRSRRVRRRSSDPGRLRVWNLSSGKILYDLDAHGTVDAVQFSADGRYLISAGRWEGEEKPGNGFIVWNADNGVREKIIATNDNVGPRWLDISPDSQLIAVASGQFDKLSDTTNTAIHVFSPASGVRHWKHVMDGPALPIQFLPDGETLAVLHNDKEIVFLNARNGQTIRTLANLDMEIPNGNEPMKWTNLAVCPVNDRLAITRVHSKLANDRAGTHGLGIVDVLAIDKLDLILKPFGQTSNAPPSSEDWVISWDIRHDQRGGGEVENMLTIYADGRVTGTDYPNDDFEARFEPGRINELIEKLKQYAKKREVRAMLDFTGLPYSSDKQVYDALQSAIERTADPLPRGLWDADAQRITIRDKSGVYDVLSVSAIPDHPDVVNGRLSEIGAEPQTAIDLLLRIRTVAVVGGPDELLKMLAFATDELQQKTGNADIQLLPVHVSMGGRDTDGDRRIKLLFAGDTAGKSFKSGQMTVVFPVNGEPYIDDAIYVTRDLKTIRWGHQVGDDLIEQPSLQR